MIITQGRSTYLRRSIVIGFCVGLVAAAFSISPAGQWIERTIVLKWMFELRGERAPPEDVIIVSMDKGGADLPILHSGSRLWSRHLYSSLIHRLSDAEAAGIIMDVTFEDASEAAADSALENSMLLSNRVVIFKRLSRPNHSNSDITVDPLPRFASAVRANAVFPLPKLSRVDGYWPFFRVRKEAERAARYRELPSLPVAALQLRLLDEIGITPFKHFLGVDLLKVMDASDAGEPVPGDVSSLISNLRAVFSGSEISEKTVDKLIQQEIGKGSPIETMLRSLLQIYTTEGMLSLNFYGPSRTIKTIDHMTVLSKANEDIQSLHEQVSGKMVFIGHSSKAAVDQRDGFRTVYTQYGIDLSGVEIAATAYANLTDGSVPRPLSTPQTILIHVLFAIAVAYIALCKSILKAFVFTIFLIAGYSAFSISLFANAYSLLPISGPLFFLLPMILFATLLFRYFGTDRQAGVYRHGIQTLLPSRVVADIESGHLEQAEHQYLNGICMMTDIANFTHYTEEQGHERMGSLSREYFSIVMDEIYKSGGELFDVEGDGLTAFWDHPVVNVEAGHLAASTAFQITREVVLFNERHPDTPFDTRIGLDIGSAEATYIGSTGNRRYCLVGDVANTSSRLEGLNKRLGTSVLATKAVVSESTSLLLRPVGVFLLKGKRTELEVFEIINLQSLATVKEQTLCIRFAKAIEQISEGRFVEAEHILVDILLEYGTDGPARFFLELLNGQNSPDVRLEEQGVVRVDGK